MKMAALIVGIVMTAAAAVAQGTVFFSNASTAIGDTTKLNHWTDAYQGISTQQAPVSTVGLVAGELVSSNKFPALKAQLYWGTSTATAITELTAVTGPPAPFRSTTSVNVGSWNGGVRTVDEWGAGEFHQMAVIIWDLNQAPDGFAALEELKNNSYNGLYGQSELFQYVTPSNLANPFVALLMNLEPFDVAYYAAIPEPPVCALAGVGTAAFLVLGRKRQTANLR